MFESYESLRIICFFIVPGFISFGFIKRICKEEKTIEIAELIKCLLYSTINYVLFYWVYIKIYEWLFDDREILCYVLLAMSMFFFSSVLGIVVGIFKHKRWFSKFLELLKINMIDPNPTSWDYVFGTLLSEQGSYMKIYMNDGREINGYYSNNSFTGTDECERDIYVEKICDENWDFIKNTKGMLIKASQIKYIEFVDFSNVPEETNKGDNNEI